MTQSNPPSELLNDPIASSSSNPDERTSSPATTERSQDFSHAAQMETEPIPPDHLLDDKEDTFMISSSRQSVNETSIMESTAEAVSNREETDHGPDPDDPDFEVPGSDKEEQDTDDTAYKPVTIQHRGKKKAASRKAPKKAAEKSRTVAKTVSRTTPVTLRSSKRATAKDDNKIVPDSQSLVHEIQTKPRQVNSRLPKKSFYSQPEDRSSKRAAQQSSNNAKSQPGTGAKKDNKQNPGSQGHVRPASPVETFDYINDEDDPWYPPDPPGKQEHDLQPEVKVTGQPSHDAPDTAINPNSKKKRERSPEQAEAKPRNTKKSTTRSSKQNPPKNLPKNTAKKHPKKTNKGIPSSESVPKDVQRRTSPRSSESSQPKGKQSVLPEHGASRIPKAADTLPRIEEDEGESATHGSVYIDFTEGTVPESAVSEEDVQQMEVTIAVPPPKSVSPELSKPSVQEVPKEQSQPVDEARGGPSKPSQSHKRIDVSEDASGDTSIQSHPNGRQGYSTESLPNRKEDIKNVKGKAKDSTIEQFHSSSSSQNASSSRIKAHTSNSQKSKNSSEINANQPQGGPTAVPEQMSANKAGITQHHDVSLAPITRRSMVSDSGSPLKPPNMPAGNITEGVHDLHEGQYLHAEKHQGLFAHNPPQASSDMDTSLLRTVISSSTGSEQSHAHGTMRSGVPKSRENHGSVPNRTSRMIVSPSTNDDLVGHANDFVFQAPQLHPRSVDFARKVVQEQNKVEHDEVNRQEQMESKEYQLANKSSWPQPKGAMKRRNDPIPAPLRDAELIDLSGGHGRFRKPNSGPTYEVKWKDAVNAASGGVVDALHLISTASASDKLRNGHSLTRNRAFLST